MKKWIAVCLTVLALLQLSGCGGHEEPQNLITQDEETKRVVTLFSPMEKTNPDAENVARTAADLTISMAEERLGVAVDYWTYTAEDN